jgi:uncharacterized membrane protein YeaQ/YmgE (transglycosylase-associated protein family)
MFIMAWLAVGLISGFVVGQLVNKSGESLLFDCLLGVIGAVAGGWVFHRILGGTPMTEVTLYGFGACMIGGVLAVLIYHELFASNPR